MTCLVRHVAVAITVVLHATSGILLSILSLSLQLLFPSLKQLPPSVGPISDPADFSQQHFPPRRDSGYSVHSVTSESITSDERLETPSPTLDSNTKENPDKRVTVLLASQARARAARPSPFALSASLCTLKEYTSPIPSQPGEEHGATILSDVPHDALCDSPSSIQYSVHPQEEHRPETPHATLKRTHSSHCLSLPLPGLSRRKSSSSPHLREAAALSRKGSPSDSRNHRHTSVSGHMRKILEKTPGLKCRHCKRKGEKKRPSESASGVGRGRRTDPYQAPYFFPSPVSPWAHEYAQLVRPDRKLLFSADAPASNLAPVQPEVDRRRVASWPGERMRSMWMPLHRHKGISDGSDAWP